jgi:hypothetical protein
LFQSEPGDLENRLCPKCGFAPSLGIYESTVEHLKPAEAESAHTSGQRGKRSVKKRKSRHFMLKLIGGWSLLLVLIVLGARMMWLREEPASLPGPDPVTTVAAAIDEDAEILKDAGQKCIDAFFGYLAAGTPEERNQFVLSPITTASRMVRFYSLNPITAIDAKAIGLVANSVVNLPGGKAIETHWSSQDGKKLDAVFREENGEWRLDWDHFARFSDYPWALFLAGSGAPEGEFRLLARERLAEQRKDAESISVVLHAPRFGYPSDTGFQSPEFLVSRSSRDGQLLDAAFKLARSGKQVFGSKLPDLNPEEMIRLRVKVKRTEVDMERRFEITGVTACHWYSVNDPGVEPAKPAPAEPAGK